MEFIQVRPLSLSPPEFAHFEQTDNVIIHRTLYADLMGKILTQPYLLIKISNFMNSNYVVVGLGGVHGNDPSQVYMPDWLYRNLSGHGGGGNEAEADEDMVGHDELNCKIEYNTHELLTIEPIKSCNIKVNIADNIDLDLRSAIEIALIERRTLKVGDRFKFTIIEFGNVEEEAQITLLMNRDGDPVELGIVEMNSEVELDLELLKVPSPVPMPIEEAVAAPAPTPTPTSTQQIPENPPILPSSQETAEERRRMVRESWLKRQQELASSPQ